MTYPVAYAAAFPIGHRKGVHEGTNSGTLEGGTQGRDDGWDDGYDGGFDEGFYAGVDYRLFGGYVTPTYSFEYTPRSDAGAARMLMALNAPEPTSLVLVGAAGSVSVLATRRRWL